MPNTAAITGTLKGKDFSWEIDQITSKPKQYYIQGSTRLNVPTSISSDALQRALLLVEGLWKQVTNPTALMDQIEKTLFQLYLLKVRLPRPEEVRNYLKHYNDLVDLILPICNTTRQKFGSHAHLDLEVYHDPEIEDEYIVIYVRQENYDESVMNRIKEVEKEYEEQFAGRKGWVLLTTDFRSPE
ncbi:MAG TPA: hypothetical protein VI387_02660 [Candidatus Brocadiales bacterium]|nr:hypothetical protein [Candidatus Brocadiales bacterium]